MPPAAADAEVVARYNSTRNPENIYEVRRHQDGVLSCSCPGWRFSKAKPKTCRHIARVEQGLDDDDAVAEKEARLAAFQRVMRGLDLELARMQTHGMGWTTLSVLRNEPGKRAAQQLLDALEASGLFAPRPERSTTQPRSRGVRLITLE